MINKKLLFVILLVVILFIFMVGYIFVSGFKPEEVSQQTPTPSSSPTPLQIPPEQDYSSLNLVIPGESTQEDVERINGKAFLIRNEGATTYMEYATPLEGFTNTVVLENGVVKYSIENVFGGYRGNVESINSSYGEPDLSLFGPDNYRWFIYLDQGLAFETDRRDIGSVLYFVPQSQDSFVNGLGKQFSLSDTPVAEQ